MSQSDRTGKFILQQELGRGGTAAVFLSCDPDTGRPVAVKTPLPETSSETPGFSDLAHREYELIGRTRFPGFVRLLSPPSTDPPYLVLEHCSGTTLDKLPAPLAVPDCLNILSAVAASLEAARFFGLIHGDFKAGNVFVPPGWNQSPPDRLQFIKLSDFSMGRSIDESEELRSGLGTVGYIAPETLADGVTSHQSDLFAFGVTAYYLLAGSHPYLKPGNDPHETNRRIQERDYEPLADRTRELPAGLTALVELLMASQPDDRPRSAWEVCETLESLGATYPYRRILRPSLLLRCDWTYEQAVTELLTVEQGELERIDEICEESVARLRLVLSANFRRGTLRYTGHSFKVERGVYWPCHLRRDALRRYSNRNFGGRRQTVLKAVRGEGATPEQKLILPLLHVQTVKRAASRLAEEARRADNPEQAARLYLQAGDLDKAEQYADDAALTLLGQHELKRAVHLLRGVVRVAAERNESYRVRRLYLTLGNVQKTAGDVVEALETLNRLVSLYEGEPTDKLLALAYKQLGDVHKLRQDPEAGLEALNRAQQIFEKLGDKLEVSHTHNNKGNLHFLLADYPSALTSYRQALRLQRQCEATQDVASTLNNLGSVYFLLGRYQRGTFLYNRALVIQSELGNAEEIARTLNNLGYAHSVLGDMGAALSSLEEASTLNRRTNRKKELLVNLDNLALFAHEAGRLTTTLEYIDEGLKMSSELSDEPHIGVFTLRAADAHVRLGDHRTSGMRLAEADRILRSVHDPGLSTALKLTRARLSLLVGDRSKARNEVREALSDVETTGDLYAQIESLSLLIRLDGEPGLSRRALELCEQAHQIRHRRLIPFNELEMVLESEDWQSSFRAAQQLRVIDLAAVEDIEVSRIAAVMAEALARGGDHESASTYVALAIARAKESNLRPELTGALTLAAQLHYDRHDYEACYARLKEGLGVCKQIAATIDDQREQKVFMGKRHVRYLVARIKELAAKIGSK